jgi:hypothetical protein
MLDYSRGEHLAGIVRRVLLRRRRSRARLRVTAKPIEKVSWSRLIRRREARMSGARTSASWRSGSR